MSSYASALWGCTAPKASLLAAATLKLDPQEWERRTEVSSEPPILVSLEVAEAVAIAARSLYDLGDSRCLAFFLWGCRMSLGFMLGF